MLARLGKIRRDLCMYLASYFPVAYLLARRGRRDLVCLPGYWQFAGIADGIRSALGGSDGPSLLSSNQYQELMILPLFKLAHSRWCLLLFDNGQTQYTRFSPPSSRAPTSRFVKPVKRNTHPETVCHLNIFSTTTQNSMDKIVIEEITMFLYLF